MTGDRFLPGGPHHRFESKSSGARSLSLRICHTRRWAGAWLPFGRLHIDLICILGFYCCDKIHITECIMLALCVSFIGIKHTPGLPISRTFSSSPTEILYPWQILPVPSSPAPCSHHCLIGLLSVPWQNHSTCSSVSVS